MADFQEQLKQYRLKKRRKKTIENLKEKFYRFLMFGTGSPKETTIDLQQATSQLSTNVTNIGDASVVGPACGIADPVGNLMPVSVMSGGSSATMESGLVSDRWEFPRYRLKFFNILGEGAFGQVWRCEATDINGFEGITTVAVKTLKESATEVDRKDLLSELEVMKSLEPHVNVVQLIGCCTDKDPTFVIIEYVNRGKLQSYLRNSRAERHYGNTHGKSNILTSCDLTSFMYQIAKGMDYLTARGVRDGYRLEKPEHCRRELYNIMYYCWSQDPHERPLFGEIINMLDKLLHTEMDYIQLERFPDHNYYNIVSISGEKL
ncbi:GL21933 [Drosophila persimilis]|uniref:GL21933 n=1 Tax=Drosophila persimilis TaxID=7234 RepID=B4GE08_DROPE|nr:GL21933 [Drosophila persimilis]